MRFVPFYSAVYAATLAIRRRQRNPGICQHESYIWWADVQRRQRQWWRRYAPQLHYQSDPSCGKSGTHVARINPTSSIPIIIWWFVWNKAPIIDSINIANADIAVLYHMLVSHAHNWWQSRWLTITTRWMLPRQASSWLFHDLCLESFPEFLSLSLLKSKSLPSRIWSMIDAASICKAVRLHTKSSLAMTFNRPSNLHKIQRGKSTPVNTHTFAIKHPISLHRVTCMLDRLA